MAGRAKSDAEREAKRLKHYPEQYAGGGKPAGGFVEKPASGVVGHGPARGVWADFTPEDAARAREFQRVQKAFRRDAWNAGYAEAASLQSQRIVNIEALLLKAVEAELKSGDPDTKLVGQALQQIRDIKDRLGGKAQASVSVEQEESVSQTLKRFAKGGE